MLNKFNLFIFILFYQIINLFAYPPQFPPLPPFSPYQPQQSPFAQENKFSQGFRMPLNGNNYFGDGFGQQFPQQRFPIGMHQMPNFGHNEQQINSNGHFNPFLHNVIFKN